MPISVLIKDRAFVYESVDEVAIAPTLQHTATHCNTLQHTATHCNTLQHTVYKSVGEVAIASAPLPLGLVVQCSMRWPSGVMEYLVPIACCITIACCFTIAFPYSQHLLFSPPMHGCF